MEEKGRQILMTVVSIKRMFRCHMRKADLGESIQSFATNIPNLSQNSQIECILMSHRESHTGCSVFKEVAWLSQIPGL